MSNEKLVWSGSPSQVVNLGAFTLWGLLALTVVLLPVSAVVILWKYLVVKNHKYELTTERLKIESGVFSKTVESLELYRVQDLEFDQPFLMRLFGVGNVLMATADYSSPVEAIIAVPDARQLCERIRDLIEHRRDQKNVVEAQVA